METCDNIDLISYMEGQDPEGAIARHLEQCPECRQVLEDFKTLIPAFKELQACQKTECGREQEIIHCAVEGANPDASHLARCSSCRATYTLVRQVMEDAQPDQIKDSLPLPEAVKNKVRALRERAQARRFTKVLDLTGIQDKRERERLEQQAREQEDSGLKAAYSDDLLDNTQKDENGNDKEE